MIRGPQLPAARLVRRQEHRPRGVAPEGRLGGRLNPLLKSATQVFDPHAITCCLSFSSHWDYSLVNQQMLVP